MILKNLIQYNGETILSQHGNSTFNLVRSLYPEQEWLPWKFNPVSPGFWKEKQNQINYMNWLSKILNVNNMEDWYQVTAKVIYYFKFYFNFLINFFAIFFSN